MCRWLHFDKKISFSHRARHQNHNNRPNAQNGFQQSKKSLKRAPGGASNMAKNHDPDFSNSGKSTANCSLLALLISALLGKMSLTNIENKNAKLQACWEVARWRVMRAVHWISVCSKNQGKQIRKYTQCYLAAHFHAPNKQCLSFFQTIT